MNGFDRVTRYAKERVQTTQVPASLYSRAEKRRNAVDSLVTAIIASVVVMLCTTHSSRKVSIEPPAVRDFVKQEMATVEVHQ